MLTRTINITFISLSIFSAGCSLKPSRTTEIHSPPVQNVALDCVPYQRDLTRAWNSKRGYCLGDDRVNYRPVGQSDSPIDNAHNKGSILNQDQWEEIPQTPGDIKPNAKPITQPEESVSDEYVNVIVAATADKPLIRIEPTVSSTSRVLQFDKGSSQLSKYEKQRVVEIVNNLREQGVPSVVWLQASLTNDELRHENTDKERLGINRSISVKNELADMGFKDVRIMFPVQDANASVVNIFLQGEA